MDSRVPLKYILTFGLVETDALRIKELAANPPALENVESVRLGQPCCS
jgi:hypothetical protein